MTLLSIAGKGGVRFLGTGHSTATGTVFLTVIADGHTVLSNNAYSGGGGGITQSPLAVAIVGGVSMMHDGTSYYYLPIPEKGFDFTSSLTVQARVSAGTADVGWSYRLYA
ncbi:MAG TPA: hypothetical protein VGQ76_18930 [Thermoanaerobaculia bacterium]|nr:hypothetical protein [Thermoanaerobaculia bacterium]